MLVNMLLLLSLALVMKGLGILPSLAGCIDWEHKA
uniref:Uncharacterized protein n=1 Tax=Arundo donax TaxID=35708 RepID=A0A0A8ZV85_ARUDO